MGHADALKLKLDGVEALSRGDGPAAVAAFVKRHAIVEKLYADDVERLLFSFADLAKAHALARNHTEARAAADAAIALCEGAGEMEFDPIEAENALFDACLAQGHVVEAERMARLQIARLKRECERLTASGSAEGAARAGALLYWRAVAQDKLAFMLLRQGRAQDALDLSLEALDGFYAANAPPHDISVCHNYVARALIDLQRYEEAERHKRVAADISAEAFGASDLRAIAARDELSHLLGVVAAEAGDAAKAREAIALSNETVAQFTALQGAGGKEAMRAAEWNLQLRKRVAHLAPAEAALDESAAAPPTAVPTSPFISHSYMDKEALADLLAILPPYVKPVIFAPLEVKPSETISQRLVQGLVGADGFIFIDSPLSMSSFWTAFERDMAARYNKVTFRYDAKTKTLHRRQLKPSQRYVLPLFHADDTEHADTIGGCFASRRLAIVNDPVISALDPAMRERLVRQMRGDGGIYLILLSRSLLADKGLTAHAAREMRDHPTTTMLCWLDPPPGFVLSADIAELKRCDADHAYELSARPENDAPLSEMDDLIARMFWLFHQADLLHGADSAYRPFPDPA